MKHTQRIISAALAAFLAVSFAACSAQEENTKQTAGEDMPQSTAAVSEETKDIFAAFLPDTYDGRTFTILVRDYEEDNLVPKDAIGETLNDAVFNRNRAVEERFNIKIASMVASGSWEDRGAYIERIKESVLTNDGAYDLVDGFAAAIGSGYADHLFENLLEIPQLHLGESWWSQLVLDSLTVNDKIFAMAGDISTSMWDNLYVIYFNKKLLGSLDLDDPYQLVNDGKWTWDTFTEMTRGVYADLNGNGSVDSADRFGFLCNDDRAMDNFHNAFQIPYVKREGDTIQLDMLNDQTIELYEMVTNFAYNNPDVLYKAAKDENVDITSKFMSDESLFMIAGLGNSSKMRAMDSDFGILPMPKYNEEQKGYYTTATDARSMFLIPIDVKDVDFAGTITEALCVSGHEMIIPVYKDKVLKGKNTRDEESYNMISIIRNGLVLDFANEYASQLDNAGFAMRFAIALNNGFVSGYKSSEKAYKKALESFIAAYQD